MRHLTEKLREAGIKIDGMPSDARIDTRGMDMTPVCRHCLPSLGEIIKVTNHESVNLYAEQLRKHLGYCHSESGSFSAGAEVIKLFLSSAGCEPDEALMLDGSGLSPNNNISARMTVRSAGSHVQQQGLVSFSLVAAGSRRIRHNEELFQG